MHNKNKYFRHNFFAQSRLVFFAAEVQKITEGDVLDVKNKKNATEKEELKTSDLVNNVNTVITKHEEVLTQLPKEYNTLFHNEIVRYLNNSASNFDEDHNGLTAAEFQKYSAAMKTMVEKMMKEWAPRKEDLDEANNTAKEANNQAAKTVLSAKERGDILAQEPIKYDFYQELETGYNAYDQDNAELQESAQKQLKAAEEFQQTYQKYKKARGGLEAYKQLKPYLTQLKDQETLALEAKLMAMKADIKAEKEKFSAKKVKLAEFGAALCDASKRLKEKKFAEGKSRLENLNSKDKYFEGKNKSRAAQFEMAQKLKSKLEDRKKELASYQQKIVDARDTQNQKSLAGNNHKQQLENFKTTNVSALDNINEALKNPSLRPDQKQKLEKAKQQMEARVKSTDAGLNAIDQDVPRTQQKLKTLDEADQQKAAETLTIESHLANQVNPMMADLESSIAVAQDNMLRFSSDKEQLKTYYQNLQGSLTSVDENINSSILKNNVANGKFDDQFNKMSNSLQKIDLTPPDGFIGALEVSVGGIARTGGGILCAVGEKVSHFGEYAVDSGKWLTDVVDLKGQDNGDQYHNVGPLTSFLKWSKQNFPPMYYLPKVSAHVWGAAIGTAGGLAEMAGGMVTLGGSFIGHPIETIQGLGAVIGYNAQEGEISWDNFTNTWKEIGKSMISYDLMKDGYYGVGIGKAIPNIVITIETMGSAPGAKLAQAAAARSGSAFTKAVAQRGVTRAAIQGAKEFVGTFGEAAWQGTKNVGGRLIGREAIATTAEEVAAAAAAKAQPGLAKTLWQGAKNLGNMEVKTAAKNVAGGFGKIPEAFGSKAKGMGAELEGLFGGKRLARTRLGNIAKEQGQLMEQIEAGAGKYREFEAAMAKAKDELKAANPTLEGKQLDAAARLKIAKDPKTKDLFDSALSHEKHLKDLAKQQKKFSNELVNAGSKEKRADAAKMLDRRAINQLRMVETAADYKHFSNIMAEDSPYGQAARQLQQDFKIVLERGDPVEIAKFKNKIKTSSTKLALDYMESKFAVSNDLDALVAKRPPIKFESAAEKATYDARNIEEAKFLDDAEVNFADPAEQAAQKTKVENRAKNLEDQKTIDTAEKEMKKLEQAMEDRATRSKEKPGDSSQKLDDTEANHTDKAAIEKYKAEIEGANKRIEERLAETKSAAEDAANSVDVEFDDLQAPKKGPRSVTREAADPLNDLEVTFADDAVDVSTHDTGAAFDKTDMSVLMDTLKENAEFKRIDPLHEALLESDDPVIRANAELLRDKFLASLKKARESGPLTPEKALESFQEFKRGFEEMEAASNKAKAAPNAAADAAKAQVEGRAARAENHEPGGSDQPMKIDTTDHTPPKTVPLDSAPPLAKPATGWQRGPEPMPIKINSGLATPEINAAKATEGLAKNFAPKGTATRVAEKIQDAYKTAMSKVERVWGGSDYSVHRLNAIKKGQHAILQQLEKTAPGASREKLLSKLAEQQQAFDREAVQGMVEGNKAKAGDILKQHKAAQDGLLKPGNTPEEAAKFRRQIQQAEVDLNSLRREDRLARREAAVQAKQRSGSAREGAIARSKARAGGEGGWIRIGEKPPSVEQAAADGAKAQLEAKVTKTAGPNKIDLSQRLGDLTPAQKAEIDAARAQVDAKVTKTAGPNKIDLSQRLGDLTPAQKAEIDAARAQVAGGRSDRTAEAIARSKARATQFGGVRIGGEFKLAEEGNVVEQGLVKAQRAYDDLKNLVKEGSATHQSAEIQGLTSEFRKVLLGGDKDAIAEWMAKKGLDNPGQGGIPQHYKDVLQHIHNRFVEDGTVMDFAADVKVAKAAEARANVPEIKVADAAATHETLTTIEKTVAHAEPYRDPMVTLELTDEEMAAAEAHAKKIAEAPARKAAVQRAVHDRLREAGKKDDLRPLTEPIPGRTDVVRVSDRGREARAAAARPEVDQLYFGSQRDQALNRAMAELKDAPAEVKDAFRKYRDAHKGGDVEVWHENHGADIPGQWGKTFDRFEQDLDQIEMNQIKAKFKHNDQVASELKKARASGDAEAIATWEDVARKTEAADAAATGASEAPVAAEATPVAAEGKVIDAASQTRIDTAMQKAMEQVSGNPEAQKLMQQFQDALKIQDEKAIEKIFDQLYSEKFSGGERDLFWDLQNNVGRIREKVAKIRENALTRAAQGPEVRAAHEARPLAKPHNPERYQPGQHEASVVVAGEDAAAAKTAEGAEAGARPKTENHEPSGKSNTMGRDARAEQAAANQAKAKAASWERDKDLGAAKAKTPEFDLAAKNDLAKNFVAKAVAEAAPKGRVARLVEKFEDARKTAVSKVERLLGRNDSPRRLGAIAKKQRAFLEQIDNSLKKLVADNPDASLAELEKAAAEMKKASKGMSATEPSFDKLCDFVGKDSKALQAEKDLLSKAKAQFESALKDADSSKFNKWLESRNRADRKLISKWKPAFDYMENHFQYNRTVPSLRSGSLVKAVAENAEFDLAARSALDRGLAKLKDASPDARRALIDEYYMLRENPKRISQGVTYLKEPFKTQVSELRSSLGTAKKNFEHPVGKRTGAKEIPFNELTQPEQRAARGAADYQKFLETMNGKNKLANRARTLMEGFQHELKELDIFPAAKAGLRKWYAENLHEIMVNKWEGAFNHIREAKNAARAERFAAVEGRAEFSSLAPETRAVIQDYSRQVRALMENPATKKYAVDTFNKLEDALIMKRRWHNFDSGSMGSLNDEQVLQLYKEHVDGLLDSLKPTTAKPPALPKNATYEAPALKGAEKAEFDQGYDQFMKGRKARAAKGNPAVAEVRTAAAEAEKAAAKAEPPPVERAHANHEPVPKQNKIGAAEQPSAKPYNRHLNDVIVEDLGESAEKYSQYRYRLNKMKIEAKPELRARNPNFTEQDLEAAARAKLFEGNRELWEAGVKHESLLEGLAEQQEALSEQVLQGVAEKNRPTAQQLLKDRTAAQIKTIETRPSYEKYRKKVGEEPTQLETEFRNVLEGRKPKEIQDWKYQHPDLPEGWQNAFDHIEYELRYNTAHNDLMNLAGENPAAASSLGKQVARVESSAAAEARAAAEATATEAAQATTRLLEENAALEKAVAGTQTGFDNFQKLCEAGNPQALEALNEVREILYTVRSGGVESMDAWLQSSFGRFPKEWQDAFGHMSSKAKLEANLGELAGLEEANAMKAGGALKPGEVPPTEVLDTDRFGSRSFAREQAARDAVDPAKRVIERGEAAGRKKVKDRLWREDYQAKAAESIGNTGNPDIVKIDLEKQKLVGNTPAYREISVLEHSADPDIVLLAKEAKSEFHYAWQDEIMPEGRGGPIKPLSDAEYARLYQKVVSDVLKKAEAEGRVVLSEDFGAGAVSQSAVEAPGGKLLPGRKNPPALEGPKPPAAEPYRDPMVTADLTEEQIAQAEGRFQKMPETPEQVTAKNVADQKAIDALKQDIQKLDEELAARRAERTAHGEPEFQKGNLQDTTAQKEIKRLNKNIEAKKANIALREGNPHPDLPTPKHVANKLSGAEKAKFEEGFSMFQRHEGRAMNKFLNESDLGQEMNELFGKTTDKYLQDLSWEAYTDFQNALEEAQINKGPLTNSEAMDLYKKSAEPALKKAKLHLAEARETAKAAGDVVPTVEARAAEGALEAQRDQAQVDLLTREIKLAEESGNPGMIQTMQKYLNNTRDRIARREAAARGAEVPTANSKLPPVNKHPALAGEAKARFDRDYKRYMESKGAKPGSASTDAQVKTSTPGELADMERLKAEAAEWDASLKGQVEVPKKMPAADRPGAYALNGDDVPPQTPRVDVEIPSDALPSTVAKGEPVNGAVADRIPQPKPAAADRPGAYALNGDDVPKTPRVDTQIPSDALPSTVVPKGEPVNGLVTERMAERMPQPKPARRRSDVAANGPDAVPPQTLRVDVEIPSDALPSTVAKGEPVNGAVTERSSQPVTAVQEPAGLAGARAAEKPVTAGGIIRGEDAGLNQALEGGYGHTPEYKEVKRLSQSTDPLERELAEKIHLEFDSLTRVPTHALPYEDAVRFYQNKVGEMLQEAKIKRAHNTVPPAREPLPTLESAAHEPVTGAKKAAGNNSKLELVMDTEPNSVVTTELSGAEDGVELIDNAVLDGQSAITQRSPGVHSEAVPHSVPTMEKAAATEKIPGLTRAERAYFDKFKTMTAAEKEEAWVAQKAVVKNMFETRPEFKALRKLLENQEEEMNFLRQANLRFFDELRKAIQYGPLSEREVGHLFESFMKEPIENANAVMKYKRNVVRNATGGEDDVLARAREAGKRSQQQAARAAAPDTAANFDDMFNGVRWEAKPVKGVDFGPVSATRDTLPAIELAPETVPTMEKAAATEKIPGLTRAERAYFDKFKTMTAAEKEEAWVAQKAVVKNMFETRPEFKALRKLLENQEEEMNFLRQANLRFFDELRKAIQYGPLSEREVGHLFESFMKEPIENANAVMKYKRNVVRNATGGEDDVLARAREAGKRSQQQAARAAAPDTVPASTREALSETDFIEVRDATAPAPTVKNAAGRKQKLELVMDAEPNSLVTTELSGAESGVELIDNAVLDRASAAVDAAAESDNIAIPLARKTPPTVLSETDFIEVHTTAKNATPAQRAYFDKFHRMSPEEVTALEQAEQVHLDHLLETSPAWGGFRDLLNPKNLKIAGPAREALDQLQKAVANARQYGPVGEDAIDALFKYHTSLKTPHGRALAKALEEAEGAASPATLRSAGVEPAAAKEAASAFEKPVVDSMTAADFAADTLTDAEKAAANYVLNSKTASGKFNQLLHSTNADDVALAKQAQANFVEALADAKKAGRTLDRKTVTALAKEHLGQPVGKKPKLKLVMQDEALEEAAASSVQKAGKGPDSGVIELSDADVELVDNTVLDGPSPTTQRSRGGQTMAAQDAVPTVEAASHAVPAATREALPTLESAVPDTVPAIELAPNTMPSARLAAVESGLDSMAAADVAADTFTAAEKAIVNDVLKSKPGGGKFEQRLHSTNPADAADVALAKEAQAKFVEALADAKAAGRPLDRKTVTALAKEHLGQPVGKKPKLKLVMQDEALEEAAASSVQKAGKGPDSGVIELSDADVELVDNTVVDQPVAVKSVAEVAPKGPAAAQVNAPDPHAALLDEIGKSASEYPNYKYRLHRTKEYLQKGKSNLTGDNLETAARFELSQNHLDLYKVGARHETLLGDLAKEQAAFRQQTLQAVAEKDVGSLPKAERLLDQRVAAQAKMLDTQFSYQKFETAIKGQAGQKLDEFTKLVESGDQAAVQNWKYENFGEGGLPNQWQTAFDHVEYRVKYQKAHNDVMHLAGEDGARAVVEAPAVKPVAVSDAERAIYSRVEYAEPVADVPLAAAESGVDSLTAVETAAVDRFIKGNRGGQKFLESLNSTDADVQALAKEARINFKNAMRAAKKDGSLTSGKFKDLAKEHLGQDFEGIAKLKKSKTAALAEPEISPVAEPHVVKAVPLSPAEIQAAETDAALAKVDELVSTQRLPGAPALPKAASHDLGAKSPITQKTIPRAAPKLNDTMKVDLAAQRAAQPAAPGAPPLQAASNKTVPMAKAPPVSPASTAKPVTLRVDKAKKNGARGDTQPMQRAAAPKLNDTIKVDLAAQRAAPGGKTQPMAARPTMANPSKGPANATPPTASTRAGYAEIPEPPSLELPTAAAKNNAPSLDLPVKVPRAGHAEIPELPSLELPAVEPPSAPSLAKVPRAEPSQPLPTPKKLYPDGALLEPLEEEAIVSSDTLSLRNPEQTVVPGSELPSAKPVKIVDAAMPSAESGLEQTTQVRTVDTVIEARFKAQAKADHIDLDDYARLNPDDPNRALFKERFKEAVENRKAVDAGHATEAKQTPLSKILERLQQRDPVAYQRLLESDLDVLIDHDVIGKIVGGIKHEKPPLQGTNKITYYVGKQINAGGEGAVYHTVFVQPPANKFEVGVVKRVLEHGDVKLVEFDGRSVSHVLENSRASIGNQAKMAGDHGAVFDHPNIMKPIAAFDDAIIFPKGTRTLDGAIRHNFMTNVEAMDALLEFRAGMKELETHGLFDFDRKPANAMQVKVGNKMTVQHIDLEPMPNADIRTLSRYKYSDGYGLTPSEFVDIAKSLVERHGTDEAIIDASLGRAFHNRALGRTMEQTFNQYFPGWKKNSPGTKSLVERLQGGSSKRVRLTLKDGSTEVATNFKSNPAYLVHMGDEGLAAEAEALLADLKNKIELGQFRQENTITRTVGRAADVL